MWRSIVYAASHRLDLRRLLFTGERSVRELLDTWPELPIFVPLCGLSDEIDGEARALSTIGIASAKFMSTLLQIMSSTCWRK
jgi:hypothetical protein